jgi:hypothetical protein
VSVADEKGYRAALNAACDQMDAVVRSNSRTVLELTALRRQVVLTVEAMCEAGSDVLEASVMVSGLVTETLLRMAKAVGKLEGKEGGSAPPG